ncbi:nuclear transport factor 2 family protein [Trinickia sp.]|uniref:nuclear transport factor 2 family protein n=1 Tax=Trinickia sp. TaxID=2571163 RepID=UPI003F7ED227
MDNRHPNAKIVADFYRAFQQLDADAMARCYTDDVVFSDPAFGTLKGDAARDMWRMLAQRAEGFSLTFSDIAADDRGGHAHWTATYRFNRTGRIVVNQIEARFAFRNGLIAEHHDSFDLWRWSRQALGLKGTLLGWTPFVQRAIRAQARTTLDAYRARAAT